MLEILKSTLEAEIIGNPRINPYSLRAIVINLENINVRVKPALSGRGYALFGSSRYRQAGT